MLRTLELENYRGFRHFELHDLGRVNLVVGTNNSGKTSILEAVHLLTGVGGVWPIWAALTGRGEVLDAVEDGDSSFDIRHLFNGRAAATGTRFVLGATASTGALEMTAKVVDFPSAAERQEDGLRTSPEEIADSDTGRSSILDLQWHGPWGSAGAGYRINRSGGVVPNPLRRSSRDPKNRQRTRFVTASSFTPNTVIDLFEEVVLTPNEDVLIRALNIIEPNIERIAATGTRWSAKGGAYAKGGMLLRCHGNPDRIPIGSMGDGIWRILALALALVNCRDGILLVDEIDTGLHYSVMEKLWRLVTETARRLNVQVFATTHSRDCFESLAAVCREDVSAGSEVTIQRIEREKVRAVAYTEQEIVAAARRGLEVR